MPTAASAGPSSLRRRFKKPQRRISAILRSMAEGPQEAVTVREMSTAFGARVFGAFFILFGGMNLIPLPPGASVVSGLPLVVVTLQFAIGRRRLWLPERLLSAKLKTSVLRAVLTKLGPLLRRIERLARPRWWPGFVGLETVVGCLALVLAVLVLFPAPLTNMFPGVAIALLGIAITAQDGLWLAAGFIAAIGSILLLVVVYGATILAILSFL